ncbi:hypothetical protein [Brevundimonas sp.]|jgi:hypothetical protein|uniref:hypothetical protein n=1 Tax=Brevundimonas sp. TaxID=1871086 RepID=UPI0037C0DE92
MRRLQAATLGLALAAGGLSACSPQNGAQAQANDDRPDPGPTPAPTQSEQDKAVIAATPQVSLSSREREEFRELARGNLDDAAKQLAKGFSAVAGQEDQIVAMQPTEVHAWRINLRRGQAYRILAECDAECTDLDLELMDGSGKIIERDTLPDSYPVLNIEPAADGVYTARLVMKTCTIAPCFAAARLYHQTGPIPEDDEDGPPPQAA